MNPIIYAIPVFLLTMLGEHLLLAWRRGEGYDPADTLMSLSLGVLSQASGLVTKAMTIGIYTVVYALARPKLSGHDSFWRGDSLLTGVAALLVYDLCYYWFHRISHERKIFWAAHVVHHSSEYYNLSTALRQTSTGAMLGWLFYLPMAVMGIPPSVFVTVALIDLLYQYWVHTELVKKLGWFDNLFVSPSNHRVHHGQNDYCIDRNFGGMLIIWDRIFGTFAAERDDERICYGIRNPLRSFNPLWGNAHYYAEIWADIRAARGVRAKLCAPFAPPAGWAAGPLEHFASSNFNRHQVAASRGALAMAAGFYVALNAGLIALLVAAPRMSHIAMGLAVAGLLAGAGLIGVILRGPRPIKFS